MYVWTTLDTILIHSATNCRVIRQFAFQWEEAHLTRTYHMVFRFCQLENIDCLVLRYLNTGEPPFKEWEEEWSHDGEV
jgi:hypothetical protein